jgi:hypothetical protein
MRGSESAAPALFHCNPFFLADAIDQRRGRRTALVHVFAVRLEYGQRYRQNSNLLSTFLIKAHPEINATFQRCHAGQYTNSENRATDCSRKPLACAIAKAHN